MSQTMSIGIIDIYWLGKKIDAEKGARFTLPGYNNNPVNAGRRTYRSQEWMHGECTASTVFSRGRSAEDFAPGAEGELQIVCDSGQTYTSPDAFLTKRPQITGGDGGKVELVWNFSTYSELLA